MGGAFHERMTAHRFLPTGRKIGMLVAAAAIVGWLNTSDNFRQPSEGPTHLEKVGQLSNFGIRNNDPKLMPFVSEIGASRVRIAADNYDWDDPKIKEALDAAKERNLKILYVFNPSTMPLRARIYDHLREVIGRYDVDLEIGNEPDSIKPNKIYWQDYIESGSLESFAEFVKITIEEARRIKPDMRIIITALSDPEKHQALLVKNLKDAGVDLDGVEPAVHVYSALEAKRRIAAVKKATDKQYVVVTELGIDGDNLATSYPELLDTATRLGATEIYIHELGRHEEEWGFVDPHTGEKASKFFIVRRWAQREFAKQQKTVGKT